LSFLDQVNFILENDDIIQLHDLDSSQMLLGLRLRTRLVSSYRMNLAI
jgi:hypothetical protein